DSLKAGRHPLTSEDTQDGFIGLTACKFIEGYKKKAPFYLNVSFIGPHPPYEVPAGFSETSPQNTKAPIGAEAEPTMETKKKRAVYEDMISQIDHYVGELIKSLKKTGQLENTVFLFTADHGDNLGDFGIWDKRYFYEQSAGVPFFISGKGIPGRDVRLGNVESKALVSTLDIYPTVLSLADIPDNGKRPGRNLLDIIKDKKMREVVFSQLGTLVMIRTAGWKMVFDPQEGGAWYLFNLISDPHELNNLAGVAGYEGITATLTARLLSFYINMDQSVQMKEQLRLQKVRVGIDN
ncbi:MAG TPA: sulfatase-like hydrolase/transferase, partial [Puia sp.]